MQPVVHVNPFRCQMWALHDRLEDYVTAASCRAEIESFCKHGQLVPTLGRALKGNPDYDVELIYGARRLFVARHLNKHLMVEIREMNDRDALIAMDIENRQRTDISPYERGLSYATWLRSGHFQSQDDIARALKVSSSQVSRLLKLARLPSVVVDAFASPADICEAWGLELIDALDDPERRAAVTRRARAIGQITPRRPGRDVFGQLLRTSPGERRARSAPRPEVVKDMQGRPLFRIHHQINSVALVLPLAQLTWRSLERVRRAVTQALQSEASEFVGPPSVLQNARDDAAANAVGLPRGSNESTQSLA